VAILAPFAGKLADAQNNEAASWLPADAESTQVLDVASTFVSADTIPAVVVYERDGGLTPDDLAKAQADAATWSTLTTLGGEVVGPVGWQDGEALQTLVPLAFGTEGGDLVGGVVDDMRAQAEDGADGLAVHITGPAGQAADSAGVFSNIDGKLLYAAGAVVV